MLLENSHNQHATKKLGNELCRSCTTYSFIELVLQNSQLFIATFKVLLAVTVSSIQHFEHQPGNRLERLLIKLNDRGATMARQKLNLLQPTSSLNSKTAKVPATSRTPATMMVWHFTTLGNISSQIAWAIIRLSKPRTLRHGARDQIFQAPSRLCGEEPGYEANIVHICSPKLM